MEPGRRWASRFETVQAIFLVSYWQQQRSWFILLVAKTCAGEGARATCNMPPYKSLERPKYEYRRRLPHYQNASGALFVTFRVLGTLVLSDSARDIALQHCLYDHGKRIHLSAAVIMPNHVHLLFWALRDNTGWPIPLVDILQSLKGSSAHSINKLLHRSGPVWQEESFDHVLRSEESWEGKREYIRQNPVRAGLVRKPEDYRWLWLNANE
jgi:putative transposase